MSTWEIKVLYYGKITCPKSALTPGLDPGLTVDWPYLGFLLQRGKRNILVDTGISDSFIIDGKAWGGWPADAGRAYLEKSLAGARVDPLDIDTILFTHLHNDHAANSTMFKKARLIFQKDEWTTLLDPLPVRRGVPVLVDPFDRRIPDPEEPPAVPRIDPELADDRAIPRQGPEDPDRPLALRVEILRRAPEPGDPHHPDEDKAAGRPDDEVRDPVRVVAEFHNLAACFCDLDRIGKPGCRPPPSHRNFLLFFS